MPGSCTQRFWFSLRMSSDRCQRPQRTGPEWPHVPSAAWQFSKITRSTGWFTCYVRICLDYDDRCSLDAFHGFSWIFLDLFNDIFLSFYVSLRLRDLTWFEAGPSPCGVRLGQRFWRDRYDSQDRHKTPTWCVGAHTHEVASSTSADSSSSYSSTSREREWRWDVAQCPPQEVFIRSA